MKKFLIYHLPVILYGALIIYLSSIPNLKPPDISLFKYDKVIHLLEYAIFAFLIYRSFLQLFAPRNSKYVAYISFLFLSLFAVFDEFFQSRIPGRDANVFDVLSDLLGGLVLIIILHFNQKNSFPVNK